MVGADAGRVVPTDDDDTFTVTLTGVDPDVLAFTDVTSGPAGTRTWDLMVVNSLPSH